MIDFLFYFNLIEFVSEVFNNDTNQNFDQKYFSFWYQ